MYEYILTTFTLDETKPLVIVEPLNGCLLYTSDAADEYQRV